MSMRIKLDDERLIELVKKHSVLYNLAHTKYLDSKLKDNIWGVIGRQLKVQGTLCKSRWNNIRDQFRKRLKDNEAKAAQGDKMIKLYKYNEQLAFLKPYLKDTKIGINNQNNSQTDDSLLEDYDDNSPYEDPVDFVQVASPRSEASSPSQSHNNPPDPLMEYLVKKQEAIESTHPIDAFLAGLAPMLKSLGPYHQHKAKAELFAVVQKYELEMLKENQSIIPPEGFSAAKKPKIES